MNKLLIIVMVLFIEGCSTYTPPVLSKTRQVSIYSPEQIKTTITINENGKFRKSFESGAHSTGNILSSNITVTRKKHSEVVGRRKVSLGSTYNIHTKQITQNTGYVDDYKHSWVVDNVYSTPLRREISSKNLSSKINLYKNGKLIKKTNNNLAIEPKSGVFFTSAYKGKDLKPSLKNIFGNDYMLLDETKVKYNRFIVQSRSDTVGMENALSIIHSKFDRFVTNLDYSAFKENELIRHKDTKITANDSEPYIFYSIDYKSSLSRFFNTIQPNSHDIKFEAYDSLTHLPIRNLKFKFTGIEKALYSRSYFYNSKKLKNIKNELIIKELEHFIKPEWFYNSTYKEMYSNGSKLKFSENTHNISLRTLHPDYMSFNANIALKPHDNIVKVFVDRVGTVNRNSASMSGGSLSVE